MCENTRNPDIFSILRIIVSEMFNFLKPSDRLCVQQIR